VLINVVCPQCGINYHLNEEMHGKPMRCQNVSCRRLFVIGKAEPEPLRPDQQLGHVGDLIPLLPSQPETFEAPTPHVSDVLQMLPARSVDSAWSAPPPVRRQVPSEAPAPEPEPPKKDKPKTKVPKAKPTNNGPRVVEPGGWDAPPVRRDKEPKTPTPATAEAKPEVRPVRFNEQGWPIPGVGG